MSDDDTPTSQPMAAAASCVDATNGLTVTPRVEGDYHAVLRAFDAVGASVTLAEWSVSIRVRPAFELAAEWAFRLEKLSQQGTTLEHDGEVSEKRVCGVQRPQILCTACPNYTSRAISALCLLIPASMMCLSSSAASQMSMVR